MELTEKEVAGAVSAMRELGDRAHAVADAIERRAPGSEGLPLLESLCESAVKVLAGVFSAKAQAAAEVEAMLGPVDPSQWN